jgi:hypothetical protein
LSFVVGKLSVRFVSAIPKMVRKRRVRWKRAKAFVVRVEIA